MRGIFPRLLLSFFLTFLVAGLLSGLVMFSFSRHSVESARHDFLEQLHANIARSVVLMGQAAYMMRQHRGDRAFIDYIREIESSMRTTLYLVVEGTILPEFPVPDQLIVQLAGQAGVDSQPLIRKEADRLVVVQRLSDPERQAYVVIGLHHLGPPPGMKGPPPPPMEKPGHGPPPPQEEGLLPLVDRMLGLRFIIFLPVAGVICYLLARSFSAPLAQLRRVSRQIAAGDLSARVGTNLGKPGDELGDLGRDFDLMAERMESLVNDQKRLLLDISHELRSPLARLNLALELAKNRFGEDDGNLNRIARESSRLNELIGQLLTLTRSESLVVDATMPPVRLADLILEIAGDVEFEIRKKGKGVKVLDLETVEVSGSRELLRQGIENIVRNGAHYTRPESWVEISLRCNRHEGEKHLAVIRIRDYGPGVPEDTLDYLTEPFFRVAEARDRSSGGVGLGLTIALQAIQQHGGALSFANSPDGNGLVVEIMLPIRETVTTSNPEDRPADGSGRSTTFS